MKRLFVALLIVLFVASVSFAAGSACTSVSEKKDNLRFITWTWTSDDTNGSVTCTAKGIATGVNGLVLGIKFTPGSAVPSNAYDVVIGGTDGADVAMGVGADLTNDKTLTTQWKKPENTNGGPVILYNENLAPVVTNAGNSKTGSITMCVY